MAAPLPKLRQDLSMPGLVASERRCFAKLEDPRRRQSSVRHTLSDTLSAALAMFSLKYPSLLQFDRGLHDDAVVRHNLHVSVPLGGPPRRLGRRHHSVCTDGDQSPRAESARPCRARPVGDASASEGAWATTEPTGAAPHGRQDVVGEMGRRLGHMEAYSRRVPDHSGVMH